MHETLGQESYSLDDFQADVIATRFSHEDSGIWQHTAATSITNEAAEALYQHGPGPLLLLPPFTNVMHVVAQPEKLTDEMSEELGDMLWFGFDVAARLNQSAAELCAASLARHTGIDVAVNSFAELQQDVAAFADEIGVRNKYGITTSLRDNPYYVFVRVVNRLSKALDGRQYNTTGLATATDLEPPSPIEDTLGDYLNTLSFVVSECLGWELEDVALYNVQKNSERQTWGKDAGKVLAK